MFREPVLPKRPYTPEVFELLRTVQAWWTEHPELHGRPAIVLVSGGVDSMSLWAALELCLVEKLIQFPCLGVAHVQYPYRRASAAEARFLKNHAYALGRSLELNVMDGPERLKQENQEDQARQGRLEFCTTLLKKYPNAFFMLGRHGQDQVEDFWLRVFRHPTPWTWHTPAEAPITQTYPLATVSRRQLQVAYKQLGWPSYFDHTNTSLHLRRNTIRHRVQQLQVAAAVDHADQDFETLAEFVPLAQVWTESLRRTCEEKMACVLGQSWRDDCMLDLAKLKNAPDLLPIAVWEWLGAHRTHKAGVNTSVYRQLVRACLGSQFPKTFSFPKLGTVVVRSGQLMLHLGAC